MILVIFVLRRRAKKRRQSLDSSAGDHKWSDKELITDRAKIPGVYEMDEGPKYPVELNGEREVAELAHTSLPRRQVAELPNNVLIFELG